jgi:hypothetical protein
MAVEHITYNHYLFRLKVAYLLCQAMEVFCSCGIRHRQSVFPEMSALAPMQVGQYQHFLFFPKKTPMGRKPAMLIEGVE